MKADFWKGWAGRQAGCERYSALAEGGRLAGWREGRGLPFDVSSVIRATLPGLCAG